MDSNEFKTELLKLAEDMQSIATELREAAPIEKIASTTDDFSLGDVGGARQSTDPLMAFIFS